eukprot:TRINITY_DN70429_c0_g1_i1.p1 TRINITY_DN70429_c0_g1~~TRINITY_DN70429_c0_g1_i1.p1  ORF type:complete len:251 (-),score=39.14 TRINITY_DN70429_c0_g1_i1:97-849(-)
MELPCEKGQSEEADSDADVRPKIALLNPNTSIVTTSSMTQIAQSVLPDYLVIGHTAPFGPEMIVEPVALEASLAAVSEMVQALSLEQPCGVIVAAFGDPGLAKARATLVCPVCGIGEASFLEAAKGRRKFAVATTTPGLVDTIAALSIAVIGEKDSDLFIGTFVPDGCEDPAALLRENPSLLVEKLRLSVQDACDAGAEAVIIGGGPLSEAAKQLEKDVSVSLIQPLLAAARLIVAMINKTKESSTELVA